MFSLTLRGVPMNRALEELVSLTGIDLVYTSDLVSGKQVYCNARRASSEDLLRCILSGSDLDFVRSSSGAYAVIPSLKEKPRFAHLAGSVVDGTTGEPLPYANILLADANLGTTTDASGLFAFASLYSGSQHLVVTYLGYNPVVDSVLLEPGDRKRLRIMMEPREIVMTPVVVDGLQERLPSSSLGTGELRGSDPVIYQRGVTGDLSRGATTLTGVSALQPLADLHIQGGASGEHLILLDGAPVRDPVSLGRYLGAFSPLAIDRFTVYKAGFEARYGSHLSGVIQAEHDVSATEDRALTVNLDPVSFNGKLQQRFSLPGGRNGAAMLAIRSSTWNIYRDPSVFQLLEHWNTLDPLLASVWTQDNISSASTRSSQFRPQIHFSDMHGAVRVQLSPYQFLYGSAYRARNGIDTELATLQFRDVAENYRIILNEDNYEWRNWAGQIRHDWLFGARTISTIQVKGSLHDSYYYYRWVHSQLPDSENPPVVDTAADQLRPDLEGAPGSNEHNRISEIAFSADVEHSLAPNRHLRIGLEVGRTDSHFEMGNQFIAPMAYRGDAIEFSSYFSGDLSLGLHTILIPGVRLTYLPERHTVYAEPRISLRHDRAWSRIGPYAIKFSAGLFRQYTNQFELTSSGSTSVVPAIYFWLPVDHSIAPPRAYHFAAEALFSPVKGLDASIEGYFKEQSRLLTIDYSAMLANFPAVRPIPEPVELAQSSFISPTSGRSVGASVRFRYSHPWFTSSARYSYSFAVRRLPSRFDNRAEQVPWNEPHRINLDTRIQLRPQLSFDVNWQGSWGRSWALRRSYYDYLALDPLYHFYGPFDLNQPSKQRIPAHAQLDAGIVYEKRWDKLFVQTRLYIANLLDKKNVYDWSLEGDYYEAPVSRTLPGRQPVFSVLVSY